MLKLPSGAVIGVLFEQLLSLLSGPIGQPRSATNVLFAIPIQDVLNRFGLTYKLVEPLIQARVPFMAEDLPADNVPRLQVYKSLIDKLLDQRREEAIAITAALRGAGAYGKTTVAKALCHDERIQQEFHDGILWVTLGENPGNLVAKVEDLIYMLNKERPGFTGIDDDIAATEQRVSTDEPLRLLKRSFANMGHLLNRCSTFNDLAAVLSSRLVHLQELTDICQTFEQDIPRPYLASWHLLPDLPDPALIRTLSGHRSWVLGCTISPVEETIVSASHDHTLKIWNARTGEERHTLRGHTHVVNGCAISPAGDYTVSVSKDQTLKVWDVRTGACLSTLYVNGQPDACAVHPDGEHIVAVGSGGMYFLRWVR